MASTGADSTDDEEILSQAKEYYEKNKKQIIKSNKKMNSKKALKTRNMLAATMQYVHDHDISHNFDDEDDDRMDFQDAKDEEFEDKLMIKKKLKGSKLTKREVRKIAKKSQIDEDNVQLSVLQKVMDDGDFEKILTESLMKSEKKGLGSSQRSYISVKSYNRELA